jgi:hypothetical protein
MVNLNFQVGHLPAATSLAMGLNDLKSNRYMIESMAEFETGPLPLNKGLNYFRLSTDPPRDIDLLMISIKPGVDLSNEE